MADNYTVLHLHSMDSNPYSGLEVDSITPFQMYIDEAVKCEMKAIAFTEHGSVLHNIAKKQACVKANIKYIHGEEFYVTESIDNDELMRDNYHCILLAKNKNGIAEINFLSSISMNRDDGHFYYNPRITIDELINTSNNILVLTACVGGILCRGTPEIKEKFLQFIVKNKERCWLEIQPHKFDLQEKYNQYIYRISEKYNLKIVATNDVHAINEDHMDGRKIMQKSKKIDFHDEDMCDLSWKNYDEFCDAFRKQNSVAEDVYLKAIEETNNIANIVEDYDIDYTTKYPRLYDDSEMEFKKRIAKGIRKRGIDKLPNFKTEYLPRIREEIETYRHNDAIDFMLLDSDYKNWMIENGMRYGCSRGSVSGSVVAYLINCTDVDSVKYNLNFSRFMNPERVSMADVDTDIYADDRYKVREYLFNKPGLYCCNIVTFNSIQLKAAIKDVGRAFGMSPDETQALSDLVQQDEKKKDFMPEEVREKYPTLFKYVDLVIGTITSLGRHAAGIVCSPTDVRYEFGTLSISSDPRPVSQIDMHEIDSLNFVKLDLLGLNAVGLIYKACQFADIDYLTPDNVDFNDENVINSISKDTTMFFQFESGYASDSLKKVLSKSTLDNVRKTNKDITYLDLIAMCSGAIRPAGESYREQLFQGISKDNGNEALNNFLAPTLGYLVYQEQIIEFLHTFCGFTMGQADVVRRGFAKKTGTEKYIPIIENGGYMVDVKGNKDDRYIKGFIKTVYEKYGIEEDRAKEVIRDFLQVIEDASSYLFSFNHSLPYSMIGFFIGYLRYYYPLELFTAALNVYSGNDAKIAEIKNYIKSNNFEIRSIKFGKSKAEYFMDKDENIIYQGIASIKYCNSTIADELYSLSQSKFYTSFIDLLTDIHTKTSTNSKQLEILIILDFFSDFGKNKKLLQISRLYDKVFFRKQLKKSDMEALNIIPEYFEGCYEKETEKMYKDLDMGKYIKRVADIIKNESLSIKEQIRYELEYLECINYTNQKASDTMWYVKECTFYKSKTRPYVELYNLKTGENLKSRVTSDTTYAEMPFSKGSVLNITKFEERNKSKLIDGKWQKSEEKERIIKKWIVY